MIRFIGLIIVFFSVVACKNEVQPKPNALLRLDYKEVGYQKFEDSQYPFVFSFSNAATVIKKQKGSLDIEYSKLKATLVLTYKPVENNLVLLMKDAEKLTFKHMIKADDIQSVPYENQEKKVYGKLFEVYGNAATQIQFHATDSVKNFMTGALYFYAKPNYDSILPAVNYIRKDVVKLMESLEWKQN
ncbi:gliding motility lipoprotein GldD [Flavicella marina]|uniref:gliding motility lipoprotein GldD n=1 Tax=Flavicella marina TaxID=1475951 RepID=UPI001263EDC2|nr:gliding motility lipoprotein GldD [Flavicella marina]